MGLQKEISLINLLTMAQSGEEFWYRRLMHLEKSRNYADLLIIHPCAC